MNWHTAGRRYRLNVETREQLLGFAFATPLLVVLAAAIVLPALYNTGIALFEYNAMRDAWRFSGLKNFRALFASAVFWNSMTVTMIWVVFNVGLQLAIGLATALSLNAIIRFRGPFSAVMMIPWISSFVVVAIVFLWIYHPQLGVLNDILLRTGLIERPIAWLSSPALAQFSLILANTWKFFPLVMITLFTGLQSLPRDVLEAAAMDGASRWQTLRMVVLPLLAPSIATAVLLSTIWAFNAFTLPIIMTNGGPLRATEVLGLYIFKVGFTNFDFGIAAAASFVLFLLILAITAVYLRIANPGGGR